MPSDLVRGHIFFENGAGPGRVPTGGLNGALCSRIRESKPERASRPSPSRHNYKSLTIAIAFHRSLAFDRVWQHPIKVDGTFA
jgi:hypothetical protein